MSDLWVVVDEVGVRTPRDEYHNGRSAFVGQESVERHGHSLHLHANQDLNDDVIRRNKGLEKGWKLGREGLAWTVVVGENSKAVRVPRNHTAIVRVCPMWSRSV